MFKLFNKDGVELPLTMPTEEDAKSLIGVPPKNIKEVVKDYGEGFQGDLTVASYKAYGSPTQQKVSGKFGAAYKEIIQKQTQARVKEMHIAADYDIMSQRVDGILVKILTHAFFVILGIAGGYGVFWGLSFFLPPFLVYIITGIVSAALLSVPSLYLVNLVRLKKQTENIENKTLVNISKTLFQQKIPKIPYYLRKFAKTTRDNYSKSCARILGEAFPSYMMLDFNVLYNTDVYICVNCSRPTPIYKYHKQISCINCGCKYKASKLDITLITFNDKKFFEEKAAFSKYIAEVLQKEIMKNMSENLYKVTPLAKKVDGYYIELLKAKKRIKDKNEETETETT